MDSTLRNLETRARNGDAADRAKLATARARATGDHSCLACDAAAKIRAALSMPLAELRSDVSLVTALMIRTNERLGLVRTERADLLVATCSEGKLWCVSCGHERDGYAPSKLCENCYDKETD